MTGREQIADFAGLADRSPFLAAAIAIGLFSLGGLPIFAGFTIKFYLFAALAREGLLWLAGLAIFSSLISLYYYLQVIRQMYIEPAVTYSEDLGEVVPDITDPVGAGSSATEQQGLALTPSVLMLAVLSVGLLGVIWVGVCPAPLMDLIEAASQAILPGT
jgi:NADH:ubiquinone oxidoreductase subunit 2 (subunit N)